MKYILELSFTDKPNCYGCMLSRTKGLDLNGETVIGCSALGSMPKCPEEGCHRDCPLKEVK
ncbi:MAG TPA: hypothetical protein VIM70_20450 [Clostridium sp.]|uniref:hypothetical protein n=1 Tax=Clostridium sp. TaxID=1506 RepID=UPI002F94E89E